LIFLCICVHIYSLTLDKFHAKKLIPSESDKKNFFSFPHNLEASKEGNILCTWLNKFHSWEFLALKTLFGRSAVTWSVLDISRICTGCQIAVTRSSLQQRASTTNNFIVDKLKKIKKLRTKNFEMCRDRVFFIWLCKKIDHLVCSSG